MINIMTYEGDGLIQPQNFCFYAFLPFFLAFWTRLLPRKRPRKRSWTCCICSHDDHSIRGCCFYREGTSSWSKQKIKLKILENPRGPRFTSDRSGFIWPLSRCSTSSPPEWRSWRRPGWWWCNSAVSEHQRRCLALSLSSQSSVLVCLHGDSPLCRLQFLKAES